MKPRASSLIGGHGVLAAFAAVEGEQRGADAEAAGEIGEQSAVLVVGVGDDHHDAGGGTEAAQILGQRGGSTVLRQGQGEGGWRGRRKRVGGIGGLLRGEARGWRTQENQAGQSRARWGLDESVDGNHSHRQCTIREARTRHESQHFDIGDGF